VGDKTIPTMIILVKQKMFTMTLLTVRFNQEEEVAVNFHCARTPSPLILICFAREEKHEFVGAAQTSYCS
jgi:hypothetical protein